LNTRCGQTSEAESSGDPAVLSEYLRQTGQPFLALGGIRDERARVRFTGPFEGETVVWDCEFVALGPASPQPVGGASGARSFIDIGEPGPHGVPLRVGLNLARIDRPAILKLILMIRNYRRLRRGRHEFGAA
jgi:hypothetical protein